MAEKEIIRILLPSNWKDYELIDSGAFEKLERFGQYTIIRPEPQACWNKTLSEEVWSAKADVIFIRNKTSNTKDGDAGEWKFKNNDNNRKWFVNYEYKDMKLKFKLGFTSFKHLGIFPEQAVNWDYIFDTVSELEVQRPSVLNLFAYTGGASLAAHAAGADVVHLDSVKPVVNWARENMEASGYDGIRWIVEDALKFCKREVRRGKKYNGIILDPPAYGRGPTGEKWILEDNINELIKLCYELLENKSSFVVINLYSMGFSSIVPVNLFESYFKNIENKEFGELFIPDNFGKRLPLGVFFRFKR